MLGVSYGAALVCVALGALIGTLAIAGWSPMLAAWDVLRPTHAWLNVFGFLSLVIGASLIHLLPTVAGTRIERTPASMLVLVGLMTGPLIVALGFVTRVTVLALVGAGLVVGATDQGQGDGALQGDAQADSQASKPKRQRAPVDDGGRLDLLMNLLTPDERERLKADLRQRVLENATITEDGEIEYGGLSIYDLLDEDAARRQR